MVFCKPCSGDTARCAGSSAALAKGDAALSRLIPLAWRLRLVSSGTETRSATTAYPCDARQRNSRSCGRTLTQRVSPAWVSLSGECSWIGRNRRKERVDWRWQQIRKRVEHRRCSWKGGLNSEYSCGNSTIRIAVCHRDCLDGFCAAHRYWTRNRGRTRRWCRAISTEMDRSPSSNFCYRDGL